jgi:CheY-like chemotaxis protein
VTLTVTDSGAGMSREQVDRAFDPFFTTKPLGKGTGLGLATVHAVAEQSGGHARIESELGRGTTVEVLLPLSDRAAVEHEPTPLPTRSRGGGETILLVEDEEGIRELFERSLQAIGYTVLTANDGQEALERVEQWEGEIDLLITDMVMPRVSGPELVRRLSRTSPGIMVVYMSGYSPERDLGPVPEDRMAVLKKPFSPKLLHAKVRELLDTEPAASGTEDERR